MDQISINATALDMALRISIPGTSAGDVLDSAEQFRRFLMGTSVPTKNQNTPNMASMVS